MYGLHSVDDRYEFEVAVGVSDTSVIGSVCVRLNFANKLCINEDATVSLVAIRWPHNTANSRRLKLKPSTESPDREALERHVICGPVRLKPLIDVTEQCVQVVLVHPNLMELGCGSLLVLIDSLFSSEYNSVSYYEDAVSGATDAASRRQAWRNRAFRHQPHSCADATMGSFPVKVQSTHSMHVLCSLYNLLLLGIVSVTNNKLFFIFTTSI